MALSDYLTDEQRAAALKKATKVRKERAALKNKVASGELSPSKAIKKARSTKNLKKIKVVSIIRSIHGVGPLRAETILNAARVSPKKTASGLQKPQLDRLNDVLSRWD